MKRYRLIAFINVFNVSPTFLLPVFKNKSRYFFQKIEDDKIAQFVEADIDYFKDSNIYNVSKKRNKFHINSRAVYGFDIDNKVIYGNSEFIISYWKKTIFFSPIY